MCDNINVAISSEDAKELQVAQEIRLLCFILVDLQHITVILCVQSSNR